MSKFNIVTTDEVCRFFRTQSRHFKTDLGQAITLDSRTGERLMNENDPFAHFYNSRYNTGILSKGCIGDIKFYVDLYIQDQVVAFYWDQDEFIFNLDQDTITKKGVDFYLGSLLKKVHELQEERKAKKEEEKLRENENGKTKIGDPSKLKTNPWDVRYEDVVAYLQKQREDRLKV